MTSVSILPSDRKNLLELKNTSRMELQKSKISEYRNKKGYLYEDDNEAVDQFNKKVYYENNINQIIDSDPLGLRRI